MTNSPVHPDIGTQIGTGRTRTRAYEWGWLTGVKTSKSPADGMLRHRAGYRGRRRRAFRDRPDRPLRHLSIQAGATTYHVGGQGDNENNAWPWTQAGSPRWITTTRRGRTADRDPRRRRARSAQTGCGGVSEAGRV